MLNLYVPPFAKKTRRMGRLSVYGAQSNFGLLRVERTCAMRLREDGHTSFRPEPPALTLFKDLA
jgi:hypothetical protein